MDSKDQLTLDFEAPSLEEFHYHEVFSQLANQIGKASRVLMSLFL